MRDWQLDVQQVSKRFGDTVALQEMTFSVAPGELFGFVGSNGAGKTTTMRIALGVLAADSGQIVLGGKPIDLEVRRSIGYMPEQRGLYPKMKVGQQLAYLGRLYGLSRSEAAQAVERWTTRLGIESRVKDPVSALSLGNQQRVQLAAALLHDPALLILDEPFSGLDPVAVDVMGEVLHERCAAGVTVLFSSHQLDLVQRLCDRVGIVSKGQMRAIGTVDELRASSPPRLVVHAPNAQPGWAAKLAGVTVLSEAGGETVLELAHGADDQKVLKAALKTGPVHEFALHRPTLTELFREVVAA
ncbi:MAG: transporter ATP-binding protein [Frankiales bacterium]|nr:transporter ATP-binding protein [Frankiales bacterium]